MSWIFYALLAAGVFGAVQLVDKVVLSRLEIPPISYLFILSLAMIPSLFVIKLVGTEPVESRFALLAFANGHLFFIFVSGFFYTMARVDAPVASSLFYVRIAFVAIWGYLLFDESFHLKQYFGIATILCIVVLLSFVGKETGQKSLVSLKTFMVLFSSAFLASISNSIAKYGLSHTPALTWYFYERLATFPVLVFMLCLPAIRKNAFASIFRLRWKTLLIIGSESVGLAAMFSGLMAYSLGPLTLAAVLIATMPLFSTSYILLLNSVFKNLIPDTATMSHWKSRSLLIVLGLIGVYLTAAR